MPPRRIRGGVSPSAAEFHRTRYAKTGAGRGRRQTYEKRSGASRGIHATVIGDACRRPGRPAEAGANHPWRQIGIIAQDGGRPMCCTKSSNMPPAGRYRGCYARSAQAAAASGHERDVTPDREKILLKTRTYCTISNLRQTGTPVGSVLPPRLQIQCPSVGAGISPPGARANERT